MKKRFSLFEDLSCHLNTIDKIYDSIKISLGPTGKNGIVANIKNELKIITSGSSLVKALEFSDSSSNIILKLLEQAGVKTYNVSGDGATTTILLACQLLKTSLKFLSNGYNPIFISNSLKKIAFFLVEKILQYSIPISNKNQLIGVLKTSVGKKLNKELLNLLYDSASVINRDGLIIVEENYSEKNELEVVQGVELDKGFASSYFVNDLKNFEVVYENPYLLISPVPINSLNQLREIIEFIKTNNCPLIIIAEEISKEIISTLVLNNLQKKFKIAVIKYTTIKFIKTGILEDLALLSHANYFVSNLKTENKELRVQDLGRVEKVIIKKDKSTFLISKFTRLLTARRINELNRELLESETENEKNIYKTRIARLSGNISKIKIGISNVYAMDEQRQKVENALNTVKSSLEEGVVPGGGICYLSLRNELKNWSYLNLIGEEVFGAQIVIDALAKPFEELFENTNTPKYKIFNICSDLGYPYGYNLIDKEIVDTIKTGLIDSSKSVRGILWNSLTIVSTLLSSE